MLQQLLNFISIEFTVMLTAALPIIEVRGAIPVGISLGLSPIHSTILAIIGSMIPVPFILFTIRPIFNYLKGTKTFKKLVHRLTDRWVWHHLTRQLSFRGGTLNGSSYRALREPLS